MDATKTNNKALTKTLILGRLKTNLYPNERNNLLRQYNKLIK